MKSIKNFWETSPYFDEQTRHEVASLTDEKEITEKDTVEKSARIDAVIPAYKQFRSGSVEC